MRRPTRNPWRRISSRAPPIGFATSPTTRTPEGYGIRYLLAETLLAETNKPKITKGERDALIVRARKYLRDIERTENDYTDRAKRLKIAAMDKQGAFKDPIDKLKTFEDCYVRAQYEIMQIGEDAKKYKDKDQIEGARKARIAEAIKALEAGLKKPEAKTSSTESNNARAMLAYYLMNEGKYKEAVEVGETFVKNDPRSSQAAMSAVYALLSYGELLAKRERGATDAKALQDDKEYQDDKTHMLDLAKLMEERWPKERAGDLARHQMALRLLREEKFPEAVQKLAAITPAYPSYIRTQFALARACLQQAAADKDMGDPNGYRKRASRCSGRHARSRAERRPGHQPRLRPGQAHAGLGTGARQEVPGPRQAGRGTGPQGGETAAARRQAKG